MPIPQHTHQQFAVLHALRKGELWGRDLRAALTEDGYRSSNASFYELMKRMESEGLVAGQTEERDVLGSPSRERKYQLTVIGKQARDAVAGYYAKRLT